VAQTARSTAPDTAERILDTAEPLVQRRGFNGFSYADIARELGITTATLHYHFAGKAALGEALVERYARRFASSLAAIDAVEGDPRRKLAGYAEIYAEVVAGHRMCLCGMLAAEYATLPAGMQASILSFFDENEAWIARVLEDGRTTRALHFSQPARDAARALLGGLEGALLVAWAYDEPARFQAAARHLLASFA